MADRSSWIILERIARFMSSQRTDIHNPPQSASTPSCPVAPRATATGLQNFRSLALKYLWRCTHSHPFPQTARSPVSAWSSYRTFSYCSFPLCLCFSSRPAARPITLAKKPWELIRGLPIRGKGARNGRGNHHPFRALFRPLSALRLPALALAPNLYPISRSVAVGRLNAQRDDARCVGVSTKVEWSSCTGRRSGWGW